MSNIWHAASRDDTHCSPELGVAKLLPSVFARFLDVHFQICPTFSVGRSASVPTCSSPLEETPNTERTKSPGWACLPGFWSCYFLVKKHFNNKSHTFENVFPSNWHKNTENSGQFFFFQNDLMFTCWVALFHSRTTKNNDKGKWKGSLRNNKTWTKGTWTRKATTTNASPTASPVNTPCWRLNFAADKQQLMDSMTFDICLDPDESRIQGCKDRGEVWSSSLCLVVRTQRLHCSE